ncbi:protein kinase domain-containing protein [Spirillospora sp. CA-255316]
MSDWRLDGFTELGVLGTGAQGRVVLARRGGTGPFVAIKYVTGRTTRVPSRDEARLMASVDDAHVARLYELVEGPEGVALVMEAVEGVSLEALLREHGRLEPEAALLVLKGSLLGLAAAHRVGVVHRDYKPANVVVQGDGASKLIDFGIATPAGRGALTGTPAYMAPEQWSGEPAGPATDVYAATCVFFECVTGRPPFGGDGPMAVMARHATAPVPVEAVPEALRGLVAHGMAKDPALRPAEAAEFVRELEAAAAEEYGEDWERRGAVLLGAAATALVALFPHAVATGTAGTAAGAAGGGGSAASTSVASSMVGKGALSGGRVAGRVAGRGGGRAGGRAARHAGRLSRTQVLTTAVVASVAVIAIATVALVLRTLGDETTSPVTLTTPSPTSPAPASGTPSPGPSSPGPSSPAPSSPVPSTTPADPAPAAGSTSPAPDTSGTSAPPTGPPENGRVPGGVTPTPVVSTRPPPPPACPRVTRQPVSFGTVSVGEAARQAVPIAWNRCLDASGIRVAGEAFRRAATTCPPASGTSCTVTVVYSPTAAGTGAVGSLVIPDRNGTPAVTVPLRATAVSSDCFPYTSTRDLGDVPVGRSVSREFTYPWRECDAEGRMAVVGGGGQFAVTLTDCPPAGGTGDCGFTVRFTPRAVGAQSATMVIPSDTGGRAVSITLAGTGTGDDTEGEDPEGEEPGGEDPEGEEPEGEEPEGEGGDGEGTETEGAASATKPSSPGQDATPSPAPTPSPTPTPSPSPSPSPEPSTAKPDSEPSTAAPEPALQSAPQAKATPAED